MKSLVAMKLKTEYFKLTVNSFFYQAGKEGTMLGVSDSKLSEVGIQCSHIGVIPEVVRGIRLHFAGKLIETTLFAKCSKLINHRKVSLYLKLFFEK